MTHDLTGNELYLKERNKVNWFYRACLVVFVLSFFSSIIAGVM